MRARRRRDERKQAIVRLRGAFGRNSLCLYVGAGASAASGVPTWQRLVLTVFLNSLHLPGGVGPADTAVNHAVGEWWFTQSRVPLEIVARELRLSTLRTISCAGSTSVCINPSAATTRDASPVSMTCSSTTRPYWLLDPSSLKIALVPRGPRRG
jgi:hypothetical protein